MIDTMWLKLMGASVKYCDVGGIRTRYAEAGSGLPLVLIHGTGGHIEAFANNIVPLAKYFHVYAIDLVGHGLSDKPEIEYILPDYVSHLRGFLDAMGIKRAVVGGVSLGGWVTSYLALEDPGRVLAVVNCTGGVFRWPEGQYPEEAAQRQGMHKTNITVTNSVTRETVRQRLGLLFNDPSQIPEELVEVRYRIYSQPRMQEILGRIHAMFPYDSPVRAKYSLTEERLKALKVPVLYLWSDNNPGSGVRSAERAAALTPRAELHVMKGCGHWPQWENPPEFNEVVRRFIDKVGEK